jgi:hypothetical protein
MFRRIIMVALAWVALPVVFAWPAIDGIANAAGGGGAGGAAVGAGMATGNTAGASGNSGSSPATGTFAGHGLNGQPPAGTINAIPGANRQMGGNPGMFNSSPVANGQLGTSSLMFGSNPSSLMFGPSPKAYTSGQIGTNSQNTRTTYYPSGVTFPNGIPNGQLGNSGSSPAIVTSTGTGGAVMGANGQNSRTTYYPNGISNNSISSTNGSGGVQWYGGRWWYLTPQNTWMYYHNGNWLNYNANGQNGGVHQ